MLINSYVFLSLLVITTTLFAQIDKVPQPKPLAITHVTVIDATGKEAQADTTVIIIGERITALGKASEVAVPKDARIVDGKGKFLIPGLWDMHAHWREKAYLPLFTVNGVTGIRIMWGFPEHLTWRKEDTDGSLLGPRFVVAGNILDGPNARLAGSTLVATEKEGRKAVRTTKRDGYDCVKVYSVLPAEAYSGIAAEAKELGIPFVGHVPAAVGAARASDMGQKSIEHLWDVPLACSSREEEERKAYLDDIAKSPPREHLLIYLRHAAKSMDSYDEKKAEALFALFVKNGTWHVPTLTVYAAFLGDKQVTDDPRLKYMPPELRQRWAQDMKDCPDFAEPGWFLRKHKALVSSMHKAGVKLLAGTDAESTYSFPGFSLHDEMALLVEAGLSPMEALQTATRNSAEFLGREKDLGTVETGKLADLVLLDADPLKDIKNTEKIAAVVTGGKLLTRQALDKMLAEVQALAGNK